MPEDLKEEDDEEMIVRNDPSDPITELFSCDHLIWGSNISQCQDVQAAQEDWQYVAYSLIFL